MVQEPGPGGLDQCVIGQRISRRGLGVRDVLHQVFRDVEVRATGGAVAPGALIDDIPGDTELPGQVGHLLNGPVLRLHLVGRRLARDLLQAHIEPVGEAQPPGDRLPLGISGAGRSPNSPPDGAGDGAVLGDAAWEGLAVGDAVAEGDGTGLGLVEGLVGGEAIGVTAVLFPAALVLPITIQVTSAIMMTTTAAPPIVRIGRPRPGSGV